MTSQKLKRIAVYTSGGDAPGMNAAIRSVVRSAIYQGLQVDGVLEGYSGLISGQLQILDLGSVANIIQRGGTILKSGRCPEFRTADNRKIASDNLKANNIDALVCIGGDGSFKGAHLLNSEHGIPIVAIPGTIDNDIFGTDNSIGFDTAINTALEAIDRIRDTAASHSRLFIVEVMGRDSGFIAAAVGLAGGAEQVFVPEMPQNIPKVIEHIKRGMTRGKSSSILIAAEGQKPGRAYDLADVIRKHSGFDAKVCILGHIQRGGSPTANDRILASRLGSAAVNALMAGKSGIMVGTHHDQVIMSPLEDCMTKKRVLSNELLELTRILSH
ncbi:MAG: 6-phosphofructokinase [Pseudobdellovibrionaceae bacterium]|nr:6-phosphofructokinase [Bdellovibrionales bacterium]USN47294.1 MAG: 6-phosphofructokinase [Pseudobdellovibrionaceae bacterium]